MLTRGLRYCDIIGRTLFIMFHENPWLWVANKYSTDTWCFTNDKCAVITHYYVISGRKNAM